MQTLTVDRSNYHVYLDDVPLCFALENQGLLIPVGKYRTVLSKSGRAQTGKLWTPWDDFVLPELQDVPGRTAIRIHAANEEHQLEGCIALGLERSGVILAHSQDAVKLYKAKVVFPHWTEVM